MAQLPKYLTILIDDTGEEFDPGVIKSEMERGMAKQRVGQSRVVVEMPVTLLFNSAADAESILDWYFQTIRRIGFFTWLDPRTQTERTGRFKGGGIGKLIPTIGDYAQSKRSCVLEYLR